MIMTVPYYPLGHVGKVWRVPKAQWVHVYYGIRIFTSFNKYQIDQQAKINNGFAYSDLPISIDKA